VVSTQSTTRYPDKFFFFFFFFFFIHTTVQKGNFNNAEGWVWVDFVC
jgi:hypothetical protein